MASGVCVCLGFVWMEKKIVYLCFPVCIKYDNFNIMNGMQFHKFQYSDVKFTKL